ncbi:hypothetical protein FRB94_014418 [Tulasnella sp. JGI-2019a]|nr:hypothetical protein FRB94_014418 [Tulasnella sp. JGI-2019a]
MQHVPLAHSQTSAAVCNQQHLWMENDMSQSPCIVASSLEKQCVTGSWTVPALNDTGPYSPPTSETSNVCRCNPVTYNLISACSVCQGGEVGSWTDWIQNCPTNVTDGNKYPLQVPSGTTIPKWAECPPSNTSGYFSAANAYALSTRPTSHANNVPRILAISLSLAGAFILLAILAVIFLQRRQRQSRELAKQRPPKPAPITSPANHRYSGIEPSPSDYKDSLFDPPLRSISTHTGSPHSINASLYDPPPPSSSGHESPARRPVSLHSATYPQYPTRSPHDLYDLPDYSQQSLLSAESISPNDSLHSVRYPPWSEQGRRYEGIMKLERIAPQPHPL